MRTTIKAKMMLTVAVYLFINDVKLQATTCMIFYMQCIA
jgi:hypothetical protein